jgi:DNA transformation protein
MKLTEIPNIGRVMKERLARIHITTPEELNKLGSKEVYKRLYEVEGDTCLDTLYGLEGAILGIRWHELSKEKRDELKEFFNTINKK